MTLYYCKTNGGFYSTDLHATLPAEDELVEITQDDYEALLDGQSSGKRIIADDDGKPVLADPPAMTTDQLAASVRAKRNVLLAEATAVLQRQQLQQTYGLTASLTDDQAKLLAQYAQELRDVPQQSGFPATVTWPDMPDVPQPDDA